MSQKQMIYSACAKIQESLYNVEIQDFNGAKENLLNAVEILSILSGEPKELVKRTK